jgi:hypothetical protein
MSSALRTRFQRPCFQQNNHCNAGTMGDPYRGMLNEFTYRIATRGSLIRELTIHRKLLTMHHHLWQEPRKHQLPRGTGGGWMQELLNPSKDTVAETQQDSVPGWSPNRGSGLVQTVLAGKPGRHHIREIQRLHIHCRFELILTIPAPHSTKCS